MRYVVFDIETKNIFQDVGKADPSLLDLAVICIYDSKTDAYTGYFQEELQKLWPIIEKADALVGYNSDHFDIPILNKYYPGDLTKIKSIDLLKEIKIASGKRLSLNAVAEATLGAKKTGNGLDSYRWWKQGEYQKVKDYCVNDVKLTKDLYEYMKQNKKVSYSDFGTPREVKLNVKHWNDTKSNGAITHTLPF